MRPSRPASRASTAASISTRQTKTAKHWDGKWARQCMRRRRMCGAASWRRRKHRGLALAACHRTWAAASVTPQSLHPPRSHTGAGSKCQSPYASACGFGHGGLALRACPSRGTAASVAPTIFAFAALPHRDRQQVPVPVCTCRRLRKWRDWPLRACPRRWTAASVAPTIFVSAAVPHRDRHLRRQSPACNCQRTYEMGGWPCGPVAVVGPRLQSRQRSLHTPRSHTGTGSKCQSPYASASGFENGGLALRACRRRWTAASVTPTIIASAAVPHRDRQQVPVPVCICQRLRKWGTGPAGLSPSLDRGFSHANDLCIRRGPTPGQAASASPRMHLPAASEMEGLALRACPRRWTAASVAPTIFVSAAVPHRDRHLRRQSPACNCQRSYEMGGWPCGPVTVVGPRLQSRQRSLHPPRSHTGTGSKCQSPYASASGFENGGLALRACHRRWTAASVAPTIFVSAAVPHRDRQQVPVPVCICRRLRKWGAGLPAGLSPSLDRGFRCANDLCIRRGPTPGQAPAAPVPGMYPPMNL